MKKFFKSAMSIVAVICLVISIQSCKNKVTPIDKSQLEGYWVLKTIDGQDASSLFANSVPGMQFNFADSTVNGTGGCNRFFGKFSLNQNNEFSAPELGSTMMSCENMAQEDKFMKILSPAILNLSVSEEGILTLKDSQNKVLLEFVKGEEPQKGPNMSETLTTENIVGKWELTELEGQPAIEVFKTKTPFIEFNSQDGKVNGNAGCNNFNGTYTIADSKITFGPLVTTFMSCPELESETKLLGFFQTTLEGAIEDGLLVFYKDGQKVLQYTKSAE